jgi:hypothetical protein
VNLGTAGVANAVTAAPGETWFSEISDADLIEASLWAAYESRFQAAHEMSLAYRYLPATAQERGHVERFFPPVQLAGKSGEPAFVIDCTQLHYGGWPDAVAWSAIKDIKTADQTFRGTVMTIRVFTATGGTEKRTVPLAKLADGADPALQVVGRYHHRYLLAVAFQRQSAAS